MGAPTPLSIKIAVLDGWLKGISRKSIAESNKIGEGTVSDIIQKARNEVQDIDLLRALAVTLRKNSIDVNEFASTIRLKKVLDRIGLPEEKLEKLLEEINVHCFREGYTEKDFVSKIDEVFDIAAELNTSMWGIQSQLNQKRMEIEELDKKIADKKKTLGM